MSRTKAQKEAIKADVTEKLGNVNAAILAEYRGMTVAEMTELRTELRKSDSRFSIINNRIMKKAIEDGVGEAQPLMDLLSGPNGIVYTYGDVAASAKTVIDFAKKCENFKVTGGVMEGKALSMEELDVLSSLPSREVLLSQIVGSIVAPHKGLLGVLNGLSRNLVQVINAIKDTKSE